MPKRSGFADASLFDTLSPEIRPAGPATSLPGHRKRLRARLLASGPEAVAEHELIEMTLFLALPRRDTKEIARALLTRFGSYAAVFAAPVPQLLKVEGLGEAGMAALKIVHAAAMRLGRAEVMHRPVLGNWHKLLEYLHAQLAREQVEQFRLLFLDSKNRLLADEAQARGTVNHTPVYPREVARRALELGAEGLILVHNHPSGDPTPSAPDIDMTQQVCAAVELFGVRVLDHVIIGNGRWTSFRASGLLSE